MARIMLVDNQMLMRRVVREVIEKEDDLEVVAEASNGLEAEAQAVQAQADVILMDLDMPECDGFEATERILACTPNSHVVIFTASHLGQHVVLALQRGAIGYITKDVEPDALIHAIRCALRNDLYIPGKLSHYIIQYLRTRSPIADLRQRAMHTHGTVPEGENSVETMLTRSLRRSNATIAYRIARHAGPVMQAVATDPAPESEQQGTKSSGRGRPLTDREREILDLMRRGRKNREIAGELCIAESTVHKHVQNIFEKLHARNRTEAIYLTGSSE